MVILVGKCTQIVVTYAVAGIIHAHNTQTLLFWTQDVAVYNRMIPLLITLVFHPLLKLKILACRKPVWDLSGQPKCTDNYSLFFLWLSSLNFILLLQNTLHLIQRLCYRQGCSCQDSACNWTTWKPDHGKETQTGVVWSCLTFIRSGQNHLARHSERGKKTRQTEEEVGRQHQGMDRPGVRQVPVGSGEHGKMEETGCEILCEAPVTFAIKG